jgi:hypothetical protein
VIRDEQKESHIVQVPVHKVVKDSFRYWTVSIDSIKQLRKNWRFEADLSNYPFSSLAKRGPFLVTLEQSRLNHILSHPSYYQRLDINLFARVNRAFRACSTTSRRLCRACSPQLLYTFDPPYKFCSILLLDYIGFQTSSSLLKFTKIYSRIRAPLIRILEYDQTEQYTTIIILAYKPD